MNRVIILLIIFMTSFSARDKSLPEKTDVLKTEVAVGGCDAKPAEDGVSASKESEASLSDCQSVKETRADVSDEESVKKQKDEKIVTLSFSDIVKCLASLLFVLLVLLLCVKNKARLKKKLRGEGTDKETALTTEPEPNSLEGGKESGTGLTGGDSSGANDAATSLSRPESGTLPDHQEPTPPPSDGESRPLFAEFAEDAGEWIIIGASVQGSGHVSMNLPCQDSCGYKYLQDGWGIAVTADGAGSAKNSQVGAAIAVKRAIMHFEKLIRRENWMTDGVLPTEARWMRVSYSCLKLIRDEIEAFAKQRDIEFNTLGSTIIVVVHSPSGLLVCHIGDGRAGYKDMNGNWHSLITPHKGDEANQTLFITSEFWNIPFYETSGVTVPEARVIAEKVAAFVLMSDGCENTSWKCNQYDQKTNKYYDPNLPHQPFFDSVVNTLQSFREDKIAEEERKSKWMSFLRNGNGSFSKESDDKTMIVGALYM